ncbi:uncharacterized protein BP5553_10591 [Venustampulla echinocandica]|uniref:SGNH hydrolase-type esterase domain-containing protein n=1 Tax=Venustampulla echinocandica TaxID=2656787 RepID=A0A370T8Z0_9HELO|nr:uncharacterized protein BP5553_10591 [Venustampulla echinocandica]RDL29964.1 hypothetical protein BP5553_10591 [Venustampulla echinocandica]
MEPILTEKLNPEMDPSLDLKVLCFGASLTEGYTKHGTEFKPYSGAMARVLGQKLNTAEGERSGESKGNNVEDSDVDKHRNEEKQRQRWNVSIDTEGVSGEMVLEMEKRMRGIYADPTTIQEPYDLLLFLGGTNDLGRMRLPDDIFADIEKIVAIPLNQGARVVLLTIPECAAKVGWLNERRDVLNGMMKKRAEEDENVFVFDLHKAIPYHSMDAVERKGIWDDGLHFTAKGYERLGTLLAKKVLDILGWKEIGVANEMKGDVIQDEGHGVSAVVEGCEVWQ